MNIFDKLSMLAQYDELSRVVNKIVDESAEEESASVEMLDHLKVRWYNREEAHERDKGVLRDEIGKLQKEIKKLNRQLVESRTALVRETEEKKMVARERKALHDQIKQVRKLLESKDGLTDTDAHRNRIIKSLDIDRLTPIQSDDSDDGATGLDYDRTEEDILADGERSRSSNEFDEMLKNLNANEQPTLLYRYLDKSSGNSDEMTEVEERRRLSRRAAEAALNRIKRASRDSNNAKKAEVAMDTDNNLIIESVREELNRMDREKLAAANSTPNVRMQNRGATLSARSAANLKPSSNASTPVPLTEKQHQFVSKKTFKPSNCRPCGGKIQFFEIASKCENCQVTSHLDCRDKCPLPCVRITAPKTKSRFKKILISDYVNKDAIPKVPALIVHCCNEIERGENILSSNLYRVAATTSEIEDLQQRILKSKSGMPNLSKTDVHLLTGVVKRFLQSLDESLITKTLWGDFAEAASLDPIQARTSMQFHIEKNLPAANRDTLAYLMQHFHAIAKHSDKNSMTCSQLAKALAPTIVGNSKPDPSTQDIQNEKKIQNMIMERIFSDIEESYWGQIVQRSSTPVTTSLGSRLLSTTPSSSVGPRTRASARLGGTLPTPKVKPLFS